MPVKKEKEPLIMHPRPSSIVAALYTLRDLDTDVVILHGPPGCSFKHARLLEEDGMRVVTTSLDESGFVFGGHDALVEVLEKVIERFNPRRIGIVGTCASMIIGELYFVRINHFGYNTDTGGEYDVRGIREPYPSVGSYDFELRTEEIGILERI